MAGEVMTYRRHGPTRLRWTEGRAIALQAHLKTICGRYYDVTRSKRGLVWHVETWTKPCPCGDPVGGPPCTAERPCSYAKGRADGW